MTVSNTDRGSQRLSYLVWLNDERVLEKLADALTVSVIQDDKHKVFMLDEYGDEQQSGGKILVSFKKAPDEYVRPDNDFLSYSDSRRYILTVEGDGETLINLLTPGSWDFGEPIDVMRFYHAMLEDYISRQVVNLTKKL